MTRLRDRLHTDACEWRVDSRCWRCTSSCLWQFPGVIALYFDLCNITRAHLRNDSKVCMEATRVNEHGSRMGWNCSYWRRSRFRTQIENNSIHYKLQMWACFKCSQNSASMLITRVAKLRPNVGGGCLFDDPLINDTVIKYHGIWVVVN